MDCDRFREAISAGLDGEDLGIDPALLERHLRSCSGCRQWESDVTGLSRAVRVRPAEPVPDLSSRIMGTIDQEPGWSKRRPDAALTILRAGLGVIAVLQLLLAASDLLSAGDGRAHALRELGSFDVALAVGFLCAAWRPIRAYGMLPLVAALVAGLGVTAAVDVSEGQASAVTETTHLLEVAGFMLVWLLSTVVRRPSSGRHWVDATSS